MSPCRVASTRFRNTKYRFLIIWPSQTAVSVQKNAWDRALHIESSSTTILQRLSADSAATTVKRRVRTERHSCNQRLKISICIAGVPRTQRSSFKFCIRTAIYDSLRVENLNATRSYSRELRIGAFKFSGRQVHLTAFIIEKND